MERYTRLYCLPENLYTPGSPVIIAAGALLLDNQTGRVMAQLKFQNLSPKDIKAVIVSVDASDVTGKNVEGIAEYQYLDLGSTAQRNAYFGQKQAIALPAATTRSFTPRCTGVVFADGSAWEAPQDAAWETLPDPKPLSDRLPNDLAEQYKRDTTEIAAYAPESIAGLWRCTCGALNIETEEACHICRFSRKVQTDALNEETLQQHLATYQTAETEKAATEAARKAEEAAALAAKRKKAGKTAAIVAAAACICIAASLLVTKVIIPNKNYNAAVALMEAGQYEEAITTFEAMDGYKDSAEQIEACKIGIRDNEYDAAVSLMNEGKYKEAIGTFKSLDGYKDSAEQIETCEIAIKDIAYNAALTLMNEGKYEEAIVAFEALDGYRDTAEQNIECRYLYAVALMNKGSYEEAVLMFESVSSYKDSKNQIADCEKQIANNELSAIQSSSIGDIVFFGTYEQDNIALNGTEKIEWLVLAKKDKKALVISKCGLDSQPYNIKWDDVTWESCTLRSWLNETFYNSAFNIEEQSKILLTNVTADRNPKYDTNPGKNTDDKVFLLSISEVNKYFSTNDARMCIPTTYAKAQGASTNYEYKLNGEVTCWWWLRSPGHYQYAAVSVAVGGAVYNSNGGSDVNNDGGCVRPAMWIDLS